MNIVRSKLAASSAKLSPQLNVEDEKIVSNFVEFVVKEVQQSFEVADLRANLLETAAAEGNREVLEMLSSLYISRLAKSEWNEIALAAKLSRIMTVLKQFNIPISRKTESYISSRRQSECSPEKRRAARVKRREAHQATGNTQEEDKEQANNFAVMSPFELRELINEVLRFLETTSGASIREYANSEDLATACELESSYLYNGLLILKNRSPDWFEKRKFMVRAAISLLSVCPMQLSQVWNLSLESFTPQETFRSDSLDDEALKRSRGGLIIRCENNSKQQAALVVPTRTPNSDPIVCLAQYFTILTEGERDYPFRAGSSKDFNLDPLGSAEKLTNEVSSFFFLCLTKLNRNSSGKSLQNLSYAIIHRFGLRPSDLFADAGNDWSNLDSAVCDLRSRDAPYLVAGRLKRSIFEVSIYESHPIFEGQSIESESTPWFDRVVSVWNSYNKEDRGVEGPKKKSEKKKTRKRSQRESKRRKK